MGKLASIAVGMALVVAGCGSSTAQTVTTVQTVTTATTTNHATRLSTSATANGCMVYAVGHDAEVTFDSGTLAVAPLCENWIRTEGAAGEYWSEGISPNVARIDAVCRLSYGAVNAVVEDDGGAFIGSQACAALTAAGWQS